MYAALLGNLLVALTKFAAAALTGSSAMRSEAMVKPQSAATFARARTRRLQGRWG